MSQGTQEDAAENAASQQAQTFIRDEYGLFDSEETRELESITQDAAARSNVGVYLLTVRDIGENSVRAFAKEYYQSHDLGLTDKKSGILFLVAVQSRDYVTITYGEGVTAFTDYRISRMEDEVVSYLRDDEWADAAKSYVSLAADTLSFYVEQGEPLDRNNDPNEAAVNMALKVLAVLVVPALIAGVVCRNDYNRMKTAHERTEADSYLRADSFHLLAENDEFMRSTVVPIVHPERNSEGLGGGGSWTDSSGFGGSRGGKF